MYDDKWKDPVFYTGLLLGVLAGLLFIYAVYDWWTLPVAG